MIPPRIGMFGSIVFGMLVALVPSLVLSLTAHAQVAGAILSGTVTDASGATVPSAQVSISNKSTGVAREVTTDSAGLYSAPNLLPGVYDVKVSAQGFSTQVRTGVTLAVGGSVALDISLTIGEVTQQVEVTGAAPTVELTSSAISAEVTENTVHELPLNGRDWTSLAILQPGVTAIHTQAAGNSTASRGNRGFGNQLSDSGHRPGENNYRINGISVNDYSNEAPGSVLGINLGVDAIQEFSVVTTNYTAEYGRTSGAVINAIGKSGTNQFHGDVYGFLRDASLDAKNYFDPKTKPIPTFHRYLWGAAAGAPIRKDRTFVFGDYESIRQVRGVTTPTTVPSPNARNGILAAAGLPVASCPAGTTLFVPGQSNVCINNKVIPFLALYHPYDPTLGLVGPGDTGNYSATGMTNAQEDYFTLRVDHKFSDKDSLAGSYFFDNAFSNQPDALLISLNKTATRRQMASLEETHIFNPRLVNTMRGGWNRPTGIVNQPVSALNPLANDPSLAAIPGKFAPILSVPSLTLMQGGFGAQGYFTHHFSSTQFYDDAFLTKGNHSLKFGFAYEHLQYNVVSALRQNGGFFFPSLLGFLTNQPTSVQLLNPNFSKELGLRQSLYGAYVQDDWRVRTNLTFNLGLRYEMATLPTEAHNGFGVIQNFYGGPTVVPVAHLWQTNSTLRNFEPRVGFAWAPFKDGKMAIHAGFGIFDMLPLPYLFGQTTSVAFPFAVSSTANPLPADTFPSGAYGLISTSPTTFVSHYVEQNPHRSYGMNWNFNIQRSLARNTSMMVGYVGSRGVHQPVEIDDSNLVLGTLTSAGYLWPLTVGTKANPSVGGIRTTLFDGNSSYNGLQAQIRQTITHGIQAQASYTWGKCIDNGSGAQIGDMYLNSIQSLIYFANDQYRRGVCDFDISHNFVGNFVWQLPSPKFSSAALSHVVGGWQLGGIVSVSTGSPFSVFIAGDPLGQRSTAGTFSFPNRLGGAGCDHPVNPGKVTQYINVSCFSPPVAPASFAALCKPAAASVAAVIPNTCMNLLGNAGRNHIYGPGLFDLDFSIFKNNYITRLSESFNLQFRAEFFNILNHPNFQAPLNNATLFNQDGTAVGGAGKLDTTSTDPRQIQFGLKIIW